MKNRQLLYKEKPVVAAERIVVHEFCARQEFNADTVLQKLYDDPLTTCNGYDRFFHRVQTLYAGVPKARIMNSTLR